MDMTGQNLNINIKSVHLSYGQNWTEGFVHLRWTKAGAAPELKEGFGKFDRERLENIEMKNWLATHICKRYYVDRINEVVEDGTYAEFSMEEYEAYKREEKMKAIKNVLKKN